MVSSSSSTPPPAPPVLKSGRGWWEVVAITAVSALILFYVGSLWSLDIGQALYYSQSLVSGPNATLNHGEAISGVFFGGLLVLLVLVGSPLLTFSVARSLRIQNRVAVFFVTTVLALEVSYFVVRPFVLFFQGVYQG